MTDEDVTMTEGSGNVFRDLDLPFAGLHLEEAEKARAADPGFDGRGLCHVVMARADADLRALLAGWRERVSAERMGEAPDGPAAGYVAGLRGCAADLEALLDR